MTRSAIPQTQTIITDSNKPRRNLVNIRLPEPILDNFSNHTSLSTDNLSLHHLRRAFTRAAENEEVQVRRRNDSRVINFDKRSASDGDPSAFDLTPVKLPDPPPPDILPNPPSPSPDSFYPESLLISDSLNSNRGNATPKENSLTATQSSILDITNTSSEPSIQSAIHPIQFSSRDPGTITHYDLEFNKKLNVKKNPRPHPSMKKNQSSHDASQLLDSSNLLSPSETDDNKSKETLIKRMIINGEQWEMGGDLDSTITGISDDSFVATPNTTATKTAITLTRISDNSFVATIAEEGPDNSTVMSEIKLTSKLTSSFKESTSSFKESTSTPYFTLSTNTYVRSAGNIKVTGNNADTSRSSYAGGIGTVDRNTSNLSLGSLVSSHKSPNLFPVHGEHDGVRRSLFAVNLDYTTRRVPQPVAQSSDILPSKESITLKSAQLVDKKVDLQLNGQSASFPGVANNTIPWSSVMHSTPEKQTTETSLPNSVDSPIPQSPQTRSSDSQINQFEHSHYLEDLQQQKPSGPRNEYKVSPWEQGLPDTRLVDLSPKKKSDSGGENSSIDPDRVNFEISGVSFEIPDLSNLGRKFTSSKSTRSAQIPQVRVSKIVNAEITEDNPTIPDSSSKVKPPQLLESKKSRNYTYGLTTRSNQIVFSISKSDKPIFYEICKSTFEELFDKLTSCLKADPPSITNSQNYSNKVEEGCSVALAMEFRIKAYVFEANNNEFENLTLNLINKLLQEKHSIDTEKVDALSLKIINLWGKKNLNNSDLRRDLASVLIEALELRRKHKSNADNNADNNDFKILMSAINNLGTETLNKSQSNEVESMAKYATILDKDDHETIINNSSILFQDELKRILKRAGEINSKKINEKTNGSLTNRFFKILGIVTENPAGMPEKVLVHKLQKKQSTSR